MLKNEDHASKNIITATVYDESLTRKLDIHIGTTIKRLRIKSGITQTELSNGTGVSLQQGQKYENAVNRVSASRLYWFARTLRTSPNYFFDSFVSQNNLGAGLYDNSQEAFSHENSAYEIEKQELIDSYFSIKDPEKRKWHLEHIKQVSSSE